MSTEGLTAENILAIVLFGLLCYSIGAVMFAGIRWQRVRRKRKTDADSGRHRADEDSDI